MKTMLHTLANRTKLRATLICVAFVLTACGSTPLNNQRYDVGVGDLTLPPNLNQLNPTQRFRLPDQVLNPIASIENTNQSNTLIGDETAWIERLSSFSSLSGSYRLVLRQAPGDLWQRLENFVKQKTNVDISSQANLGLIDSKWVNVPESATVLSHWLRYRLRIESVAQRVEIYLTVQSIDGSGRFQINTDESISELRQLANTLFNEPNTSNIKTIDMSASTTLEASASSATSTAPATIEQLVHQESFGKTWRKLELALLRGAFTIEQKNEKERYFLVRYIDPALILNNKDNQEMLKQIFSPDGGGVRMKIHLTNETKDTDQTIISITDEKNQSTISAQWVHEVLDNIRPYLQ
jgi:outer membrane protein assembly factor BamC